MANFSQVIDEIAEIWTGFNYFLISTTDIAIAAAPISSITFPTKQIITRPQKGLSSRTYNVPVGVEYTELVLQTPIQRLNSALASKITKLDYFIAGKLVLGSFSASINPAGGFISGISDNFAIAATNNTGPFGVALPITVFNVIGAVPVSYKPSTVGYMNDKEIPVEELSFKVQHFNREFAADAAGGVFAGVSAIIS